MKFIGNYILIIKVFIIFKAFKLVFETPYKPPLLDLPEPDLRHHIEIDNDNIHTNSF